MIFYLQVIGIGKALGLKIGQREGLSALDAAQLGDMYQCQTKNKRGAFKFHTYHRNVWWMCESMMVQHPS